MSRENCCLTLPTNLVAQLDALAEERALPRSYIAQQLLEEALAASRAQQSATPPGRPSSKAAREHLRRHARLSGFLPADEET